ncbi:MAG TPA: HD domain-containing protein [Haloplasmataceae bacterium]
MADLFQLNAKKIKDVQNREPITLYARIDQIATLTASNGTDYFNMTLSDDTGSINAKKWDVKVEEKNMFRSGELVYIEGIGGEYSGKPQLIIQTMRHVNPFDPIDESTFYPKAPDSIEELKSFIYSYIEKIENQHLYVITKTLVERYEERFFLYPAATRNHHAYLSGLAYHVKSMLRLADAFINQYPQLNRDLMYAGIILHDLGKVIELSHHMAPEYTVEGKLIGHISLCFEAIRQVADEKGFKSEEILILQHMVLSHHGELEHGSPKQPMILEAVVLHLIDEADATINMILKELEETPPKDFTKRIRALDGQTFYHHAIGEKNKNKGAVK